MTEAGLGCVVLGFATLRSGVLRSAVLGEASLCGTVPLFLVNRGTGFPGEGAPNALHPTPMLLLRYPLLDTR